MSNEHLDAAVAKLQLKVLAGNTLRLRRLMADAGRGCMDPRWDVVLDAEAFMLGRPTVVQLTMEGWIAETDRLLTQPVTQSEAAPEGG